MAGHSNSNLYIGAESQRSLILRTSASKTAVDWLCLHGAMRRGEGKTQSIASLGSHPCQHFARIHTEQTPFSVCPSLRFHPPPPPFPFSPPPHAFHPSGHPNSMTQQTAREQGSKQTAASQNAIIRVELRTPLAALATSILEGNS